LGRARPGTFDPHAFWLASECRHALFAVPCSKTTLEGANGLRGWTPGWIGPLSALGPAALRSFLFYPARRLDSRRGAGGIHLLLPPQFRRYLHAGGHIGICGDRLIMALAPVWCSPFAAPIRSEEHTSELQSPC